MSLLQDRPALSDLQQYDVDKAKGIVEQMLADGPKLLHRPVLMAHLKNFGLAINGWPWLSGFQDWYNASDVGVLQLPTEFIDYLLYAGRTEPASCAEIGVYTGGLAVFSCAFFQALNPDFRYVGIDVEDYLVVDEELLAPLNIEFRIPSTSTDAKGEVFDVVFIDGNHSYQWAKRDYLNLGRHAAKICAFHDIHGKEYLEQGGGIYRFWRQLRVSLSQQVTMMEVAHAMPGSGKHNDSLWMGIGILDHTSR